jgi:hypothetical protein
MKNPVKLILTIAIVSISFVSCKHEFERSELESMTKENDIIEAKIDAMKTFREEALTNRDKQYREMIAAIEPKKKAAFEKDNNVRVVLEELDSLIDKSAKEFESSYKPK